MNSIERNDHMASSLVYPEIWPIPIDLFVSKKNLSLKHADLSLTDAYGNLVFMVDDRSSNSAHRNRRVLLDAGGNPLISIYHDDGGSWKGFRGDSREWKDLIFRVRRTLHSRSRTELEVFLIGENWVDSKSDFKEKGCPFQRSCTIYKANSIVAQTSLMYKLGKIFVGRRRFRLTIFPGFNDHTLVVALLVIFFDGRK
ncbi:hypothetical protein HHK36_016072 [Tetracentron sinense]|uniref:Protein LURP-one-related 7 n=1 Tax=Tetracentron sinense TaxID=13715 RepID=A0A834Z050_TETSI|nr:hypothetical protein HHK36_016072 [Tetracentron sinense]